MQSSAEELSSYSVQASSLSSDAVSATEQASSNVATVATAAEELTASIGEITQQINTAAEMSLNVAEETEKANNQILSLSEAIEGNTLYTALGDTWTSFLLWSFLCIKACNRVILFEKLTKMNIQNDRGSSLRTC